MFLFSVGVGFFLTVGSRNYSLKLERQICDNNYETVMLITRPLSAISLDPGLTVFLSFGVFRLWPNVRYLTDASIALLYISLT